MIHPYYSKWTKWCRVSLFICSNLCSTCHFQLICRHFYIGTCGCGRDTHILYMYKYIDMYIYICEQQIIHNTMLKLWIGIARHNSKVRGIFSKSSCNIYCTYTDEDSLYPYTFSHMNWNYKTLLIISSWQTSLKTPTM